MKTKVKRRDLYAFYNIVGVAKFDNSKPIKTSFRYALSKAIKKCKAEIDDIDELFPVPDGYAEYIRERINILKKYGVDVLPNGNVDVNTLSKLDKDKEAELNHELGKLYENNKEIVDKVDAINQEKLKFVDEEIEIDLDKVNVSDVPDISETEENHWEIWGLLEKFIIA